MKKLILLFTVVYFSFTASTLGQDSEKIAGSDAIETISEKEPILVDTTTIDFSETELNSTPESPSKKQNNSTIIPSQGFSINSLWRGVLGMIFLSRYYTTDC